MSGYSTIHALADADYDNYQYFEILATAGEVTIKGNTITFANDTVLPIGVPNSGGMSENTGSIFLIGKKKPEAYRNADGTYPIR